ncbi:MAG: hypothetical protein SNJ75_06015 [Gemmataceae bacterium]
MRPLLVLLALVLMLCWAATVLGISSMASANTWPGAKLYFSSLPVWSGPAWFDYLAVAALVTGSVLLVRLQRQGVSFGASLARLVLGVVLVLVGLIGWIWFGLRVPNLALQLPSVSMSSEPFYRPGLSKVVLAYHGQTPQTGGPVLFADGSVSMLSAEQFAKQPQAIPPEYEPVDAIMPYTGPVDPDLVPSAGGSDEEVVLRRAERRSQISKDLKHIGEQYYAFGRREGRPPQRLEELALSDELAAAVRAGTYAVHLGWGLTPPSTIGLQKQLRVALFLRWASFHLLGAGLAVLLASQLAPRATSVSAV